ncbi:hypothetical protein [Bacillus sp. T33-2]|uniref:hypothetical protein n=1 Tax=Bacillus sp. T33-2 TaxID=2054168 RepID=UPI000C78A9F8|nr:hypothetical protein [Bacillus sp. T33-2]PLR94833.1 hypothetical protein CVD19_16300 [Bacillus sp. T33-2]
MNVAQINIIDVYFGVNEEKGIHEIGRDIRFSAVYEVDIDIQQLESKLIDEIMQKKGDGIKVEINSFENNHYVDVYLLLGEEQEDDKFNIDFILEFLQQFQRHDLKINKYNEKNYDKFIYARYAPGDYEDISNFLQEEGIEFQLLSKTRNTFERGASDFWEGFLIAMGQSASWDLVKMTASKIKNRYNGSFRSIEVACLDVGKLRENLADLAVVDQQDLRLISFFEIDNDQETYEVHFRTIHEKFDVQSNKSGTILKFDRYDIREVVAD